MDPSGKFLFAFSAGTPGVLAYTIDSGTGALTLVTGSPFLLTVSGSSPGTMIVDSSGSFLYAVVRTPGTTLPFSPSGYIAGFSINATSGALTPVSGSPILEDSISPFAIATSGAFLYMRTAQGISVFEIESGSGATQRDQWLAILRRHGHVH
jgi:6-phosphogluconolactonase (cycloisomerase 2 family)